MIEDEKKKTGWAGLKSAAKIKEDFEKQTGKPYPAPQAPDISGCPVWNEFLMRQVEQLQAANKSLFGLSTKYMDEIVLLNREINQANKETKQALELIREIKLFCIQGIAIQKDIRYAEGGRISMQRIIDLIEQRMENQ